MVADVLAVANATGVVLADACAVGVVVTEARAVGVEVAPAARACVPLPPMLQPTTDTMAKDVVSRAFHDLVIGCVTPSAV